MIFVVHGHRHPHTWVDMPDAAEGAVNLHVVGDVGYVGKGTVSGPCNPVG